MQSYRAYRFGWTGQPATQPSISVSTSAGNRVVVYASWNGATTVARWQLLGGPDPTTLSPVTAAARSGFETVIPITTTKRYIAVRALGSSGRVLGTSTPIRR